MKVKQEPEISNDVFEAALSSMKTVDVFDGGWEILNKILKLLNNEKSIIHSQCIN